MNKGLLRDAFGWGFVLWLIGFVLGIILFFFVPASALGWVILPIGVAIAIWVLINKISGDTIRYYVIVALVWTLFAVVFDYIFLVKVFKPADGYYKLDVYVYYTLTFLLPIAVGWRKLASSK